MTTDASEPTHHCYFCQKDVVTKGDVWAETCPLCGARTYVEFTDSEPWLVRLSDFVFCTSFCNSGHRLGNGQPVDHECSVLPPAALKAERDGDHAKAQELIAEAKPLRRMNPRTKKGK